MVYPVVNNQDTVHLRVHVFSEDGVLIIAALQPNFCTLDPAIGMSR